MDGPTATGVAWRDEVREAVARLPERQREALELRERKGLSYERIAATLGTGSGAVAQLLERARINLYDELRGTALASIAAPSAECERALPLIAARQDAELDAGFAAGVAPIQTGGSMTTPLYTPTHGSGGGSPGAPVSSRHTSGGDAAVRPAKQKSTAKPAAKPKPPSSSAQTSQPTAQPASEPAPTPPPAEASTPPAEEPTPEHGHKGDPPGKPADRPPHK